MESLKSVSNDAEIIPPDKTEAEMEALIMRRGLAWLVESAMNCDPCLTRTRANAILGAADRYLRNKHGGRSTHRIVIEG